MCLHLCVYRQYPINIDLETLHTFTFCVDIDNILAHNYTFC